MNRYSRAEVLVPEDENAHHELLVVGHGRITTPFKHGPLVGARSVLAEAAVDSLGLALRSGGLCCSTLPQLIVVAPDGYESDSWAGKPFDPEPVQVEVDQETVSALIVSRVLSTRRVEPRLLEAFESVARDFGCEVRAQGIDEYGQGPGELDDMLALFPENERSHEIERWLDQPGAVEVRVIPGPEVASMGQLLDAAEALHEVMKAASGDGLTSPSGVANLVRGGLARLLVGLAERSWFEAKETFALQLPGDAGQHAKFDLAADVASLANGTGDAVLVVGLRTRSVEGRDTVTEVRPMPPDLADAQSYRDVLQRRIHPTVSGLSVESHETGEGRLIVIRVPSQSRARKPFLVRGAIVAGRHRSTFVSLPERVGDRTDFTSIEELHAILSAGWRRGESGSDATA